LTYCGFGDLPVAEFFARIAEQAHCGLVLDVGHLWTHWRYRERRRFRSPEAFAADFCVAFPMDRVIQVHLAGLGAREQEASSDGLPFWIDAHDAPVPGVLFDLLRQVLGHPALTALKGVALEVDTKAIPAVVEEFGRFREELAGQVQFAPSPLPSHDPLLVTRCNWESNWCPEQRVPRGEGRGEGELARLYEAYARVVSGQEALETSPLAPLAADMDRRGLMRYTDRYLPHELLCWGGDLAELFPPIWSALERRGITAENFIRFWFSRPRPITDPYDFFYVKLDRWVEFIGEVAPDLMEHAAKDAEVLRALHDELNDEPPLPDPPPRGGRERGGWNLEGAMTTVRINKYFTERGFCSRRAADRMIDDGRVRINGRVAVPGDRVAGDDRVTVDGRVVRSRPRPVYLAYHKPVGVTCTTELHVPGNILHAVGYPERIFPIGRLDKDSSGLILLTNDGDIVNRILRAEFGHEREYVVTVDRPFPPTMLRRLEQGVPVLGEKTRPCWTTRMDAVTFRIRLTEGRNRQIRRMCSTLGYRVVRLVRVRIMHIRLGGLPVGQWREFSPKERDELLAAVGMREERAAS
jgi:23S rRNA pseudouridine2604 synthase